MIKPQRPAAQRNAMTRWEHPADRFDFARWLAAPSPAHRVRYYPANSERAMTIEYYEDRGRDLVALAENLPIVALSSHINWRRGIAQTVWRLRAEVRRRAPRCAGCKGTGLIWVYGFGCTGRVIPHAQNPCVICGGSGINESQILRPRVADANGVPGAYWSDLFQQRLDSHPMMQYLNVFAHPKRRDSD